MSVVNLCEWAPYRRLHYDERRLTPDDGHVPYGDTEESDEGSGCGPVVQESVPKTVVTFAALDCIPCPYRQQCTSAKSNRRQLSLYPRQMIEALRIARAQRQTKDWNTDYALRAGIEGTIRQALAVTGLRQARYHGLAKTHLEHIYSAVALNLIRLDAWCNGHPLDHTRTTHLARLELRLAA